MKRVTLFISSLLLLTTILFTGCDDGRGIVEFTTTSKHIWISTSSKAMTIDWGDGQTDSYTSTAYTTKLTHQYVNNDLHRVRINADRLTELECANNLLSSLDVSRNTALTRLECHNNGLTALDVSKNTALMRLKCYNNQLTALDVSWNTALIRLWCSENQLTDLDVSRNTALIVLYCYENQLTDLDVSRNTALRWLSCRYNQLTELDMSRNPALEWLYCGDNKLTALDMSRNTALKELECRNNQLTTEALNALFSGLSTNGAIDIADNPGSCTCDRSVAIKKEWMFRKIRVI
jgi:Leucine-rich repeat (LRR) protein